MFMKEVTLDLVGIDFSAVVIEIPDSRNRSWPLYKYGDQDCRERLYRQKASEGQSYFHLLSHHNYRNALLIQPSNPKGPIHA